MKVQIEERTTRAVYKPFRCLYQKTGDELAKEFLKALQLSDQQHVYNFIAGDGGSYVDTNSK